MLKIKGVKVVSEPEAPEATPAPYEKRVFAAEPVVKDPEPQVKDTARPLADPNEPHDDRTPEERIAAVEAAAGE